MRTLRILLSPQLLLLHAAGVLVLAATVWLGSWQYGVWSDHREASALNLADATPRPIVEVLGNSGRFPNTATGAPVLLGGTWVTSATFFVANRTQDGESGYWMVTPLSCDRGDFQCGGPVTLVVVGFTDHPSGSAPRGEADVVGWLQPSDSEFLLDEDPDDDVLPSLRIPSVAQRFDRPLQPGFVVAKSVTPPVAAELSAVSPESLPKPSATTALRNLLYGLQWWVFGGFAIFMWWRWSADALAADRRAGQREDTSDPAVPSGA